MTTKFEQKKSLLLKILPENYEYCIVGVSVRDATTDIPSEIKIDAQFIVNVQSRKILSDLSQTSGTFYNKKNQIDRSGKKTILELENVSTKFSREKISLMMY